MTADCISHAVLDSSMWNIFFVFGRKWQIFFVFIYLSAEKGNLFFGSFYFTAEKVKFIFCRPLVSVLFSQLKHCLNKQDKLCSVEHGDCPILENQPFGARFSTISLVISRVIENFVLKFLNFHYRKGYVKTFALQPLGSSHGCSVM